MSSQTLFDRIWDEHVVQVKPDGTTVLYVDRHFLHEATSAQAFQGLRTAGIAPWRHRANLAMPDHCVPTTAAAAQADPVGQLQIDTLSANCRAFTIAVFEMHDPRQGIVHVAGPEQGATLPGMTIVCGDSHTSTHGAFAAIAHGIGTSEVEHVLATQTLLTHKPRSMRVTFSGVLPPGVGAKDMALAMIARIGTAGATGHAIEYAGAAVRGLSMEARMTLCNMSIEAGARCGLVAVDDTTLAYLKGRPMAPSGPAWDAAAAHWRTLASDADARFDAEVVVPVDGLRPMVTWGTSPEMATTIDGVVPDPAQQADPARRASMQRALAYMGLRPGTRMRDIELDVVFIGSCTNARIEDLRIAADIVRNQRISPRIARALVVPGSGLVKRQAEAEGLDRVFRDAGFEWRGPGCSMCVGMNADHLGSGQRCASTSNRNFEDRQGVGGRTHLVSPAMAAAAAIAGHFVDVQGDSGRAGAPWAGAAVLAAGKGPRAAQARHHSP
ncbi:MAG: 3-isopropylmalate dehydratase large subunit [Rhodoferax sp.]|nr:3-isopropylmalate dehydratase large subunit [Rhodoferax sp.]